MQVSSIESPTGLDGLRWESNQAADRGDAIVVGDSPGPGLVDFVTHGPDFEYDQFGIHVGQVDRLTFFGDSEQTIVAEFVDCRRGSPTLHEFVRLEFRPDPTRRLVIDRGIAHTFDGLQNVVTRDEPIWFVSAANADFSLGNDVVNFPRSAERGGWPVVTVNELPVPDACYRYITAQQQRVFNERRLAYPIRFKVDLKGTERYVVAVPRSDEGKVAMDSLTKDATEIDGLEWRSNFVAASSEDSFYVVENPGGGVADILFYRRDYDDAFYGIHAGQVDRLTFFGDPDKEIVGRFVDCREGSPTLHQEVTLRFSPDPTRHLFIDRGIAHAFDNLGNVTVRVEALWYMAADNPDYDLANDVINFERDADADDYPVVKVNDLPVPDGVLDYVVAQQRAAIEGGSPVPATNQVSVDGKRYRLRQSPA